MGNAQENVEADTKYSYQHYQELDGAISEQNYESVLNRAQSTTMLDNKALIAQVELIAEASGIALHNSKDALDPKTILYGVLRADAPSSERHHYSHMGDQRLFAEALKILGDKDSLKKLVDTHTHIFRSIKNERVGA